MKIFIINFLFGSLIFSADVKITYSVDGMMCSMNCPAKVNESLKGMDGIKSCEVDFKTKTAVVIYNDEKLTSNTIAETISNGTYYKVKEKEDKEKSVSFWDRIFGKG